MLIIGLYELKRWGELAVVLSTASYPGSAWRITRLKQRHGEMGEREVGEREREGERGPFQD